MTAKEFFENQLITDSKSVIDKYAHIFNRSQLIRFAEAYHDSEVKKLNIPAVTNRTYSVDEVKILLEKQKQACANEFIHGEMSMELAKRKVLQTPIVSF